MASASTTFTDTPRWVLALAAALPVLFGAVRLVRKPSRSRKIPYAEERVVILGASSGIGRAIAHIYAARGARVCIFGRRKDEVDGAVDGCRLMAAAQSDATSPREMKILGFAGDFSDVENMVQLRTFLEAQWRGIDTLVVTAGVSSLRPLLDVARTQKGEESMPVTHLTSAEGIQNVVDVAKAATASNFVGPLVAAVTLIPILSSSKSPAIHLISSVAAVIPAPTRTLYCATKSASLILYQALAIEHPRIEFSYVIPGTVEGSFRASAVDGGPVREQDPNKKGLKRDYVARRCVRAVDYREGAVFLGPIYRLGHLLYWLWPSFVEWRARVKYGFMAT